MRSVFVVLGLSSLLLSVLASAGTAPLAPVQRAPDPEKVARLRKLLPERPWVIEADVAQRVAKEIGDTPDELLVDLMPIAKDLARAPISRFPVGEAGRGKSGRVYLGVNVELPGHPLFHTIHGEQFVVAAMLLGGETGVEAIAMPAAPCGHCRQFLWETAGASSLRIVVPRRPLVETLPTLLPFPFGPDDLGVKGALLAHPETDVQLSPKAVFPKKNVEAWRKLAGAAVRAARRSYAPYSGVAGIALETRLGAIALGPYVDNAAFNPGLPSLQVALVSLVQQGESLEDVVRAVLVERPGDLKSERRNTEAVLASFAPRAELVTLPLE
jgi:cytidine deaminase